MATKTKKEPRRDDKNRILKEGEKQRSDGRYEYRYFDIDKKRKSIYASTLKDLREKEKEIKEKLLTKVNTSCKTPMIAILRNYMEYRTVSDSTKSSDERCLKRVSRHALADMSIADIREIHIRKFIKEYNEMGYSRTTVKQDLRYLKAASQMALRNRDIAFNPFDFNYTSLLTDKKKEKKAITDEQFDRLIYLCENYNAYYGFWIPHLIFLRETGIRISEFSGLTLSDIDLKTKTVNINKQVMKVRTELGFRVYPTKTKSSNAVIPMTDVACEAIKEIMAKCENPLSLDGIDGFFVLGKNSKNFIRQNDFNRTLRRIESAYNEFYYDDEIELTPHILRHTAATRMINSGMNPVMVQKMLRHSSMETTISVYTHTGCEDIRDELNRINFSSTTRNGVKNQKIGVKPDLGSN